MVEKRAQKRPYFLIVSGNEITQVIQGQGNVDDLAAVTERYKDLSEKRVVFMTYTTSLAELGRIFKPSSYDWKNFRMGYIQFGEQEKIPLPGPK